MSAPRRPAGAPAEDLAEVLDLLERHGHDRYDEQVSQLDHALQCAALARAQHAPDTLVAAALLHVTGPIALHVRAKRYLCVVEPGYLARLSPASTASLSHQGGPLAPDEVAAFQHLPHHAAAVRLRRWDDAGKVVGRPVDPLGHHVDLLARLARERP
jgi:gamma-butyrobetaine dioxygenase